MEAGDYDLPRAFPNPGQWCWFNSLLQALASISDPRWWAIFEHEDKVSSDPSCDLLSRLGEVLHWINRTSSEAHPQVPRALMGGLAWAMQEECGLSSASGEQQDAHEALLQLVEALDLALVRRQLAATRALQRAFWDPFRPCILGCAGILAWAKAMQSRCCFQELWQGTLEETRHCCSCGLVTVDRCESKQAFRCLSLDIPSTRPLAVAADLAAFLRDAYCGGADDEILGLICADCTLRASTWRCLLASTQGSLAALGACRRLQGIIDQRKTGGEGRAPPAPEVLGSLCPAGSPPPELSKSRHLRRFRICKAPRLLALHLRRLTHGPWGPVRLTTPVRFPLLLDLELTPGSDPGGPTKRSEQMYALDAVVSHLGTAHEGHFVTHRAWHGVGGTGLALFGRRLGGVLDTVETWSPLMRPFTSGSKRFLRRWLLANDSSVSAATPSQVLAFPGAYLFIFERCLC